MDSEAAIYCPTYASFFGFAGVFAAVRLLYKKKHAPCKMKQVNDILFFFLFFLSRWPSAVSSLLL
jgi:hypothetical protein